MKKLNKKGFTLAELLIVVAIIAVLVAISIPIFSSQLEKSRDAVSVANLRAAYAESQAAWLTGDTSDANVTLNKDARTVTVSNVAIKSEKGNNWSDLAGDLPFTAPTDPGTSGKKTVVFTYDANDSVTVAFN